ncbi:NmrA family NAD(P)-binding protein [Lichenihabitans psoromatis]|uniref:NmrA family NAD(P)-binding protein n=1 Tax=Lichenihabitans psoromatis TaxID=2528642 RepID=UPI0010383A39|nr:NmrA family NAD(P)-binding protein [Lichenihabitans psoromatis]
MSDTVQTVALVGATGDLGHRIAAALSRKGVVVQALIRVGTSVEKQARLRATGATPVEVDFGNAAALKTALTGAACVVSSLNGLEPTILGLQGRLLDAAVAAGVPRFIPSDFSLDFTRTRPGDNRNMDLRRAFMARIDASPIHATSILNGAFADLLTGEAPIVLPKIRRILYWGDADQALDFTAKDDVAAYTADAALDAAAPRFLRIAGDVVSARDLAITMQRLTGDPYKLFRAGGIGLLSAVITIARTLTPKTDTPFPVWQGMQYMRDMSSGRGKLASLDNDRYGTRAWTRAEDVLAPFAASNP